MLNITPFISISCISVSRLLHISFCRVTGRCSELDVCVSLRHYINSDVQKSWTLINILSKINFTPTSLEKGKKNYVCFINIILFSPLNYLFYFFILLKWAKRQRQKKVREKELNNWIIMKQPVRWFLYKTIPKTTDATLIINILKISFDFVLYIYNVYSFL